MISYCLTHDPGDPEPWPAGGNHNFVHLAVVFRGSFKDILCKDVSQRRQTKSGLRKPATGFPARALSLATIKYAGDLPDVSNVLSRPRSTNRCSIRNPEPVARRFCWREAVKSCRLAAGLPQRPPVAGVRGRIVLHALRGIGTRTAACPKSARSTVRRCSR
jgi:hypothetical protein